MGEVALELNDVRYAYPSGRKVLSGVSLSLEKGQRLGLVGANGAGKTTLLLLIMGLLEKTGGTIRVLGKEVASTRDFAWVRKRVGLLFQNADDQLFCPTVLDDVAFGPLNMGASPREARKTAEAVLSRLGLSHLARRVSHRLSGGEKKLVSLATVLAMEPAVLLLDEPTAGLDEEAARRLIGVVKGLSTACIIVSHEYEFLKETTSRIAGLAEGTVAFDEESSLVHTHVHVHPAGKVPHKHV
ncbi:MAG: ABC transporter ATP-binding protein [Deltaproteobacteria bacterium]|nr:ABC transporter ATP-binding protein [Deltaproteobacteria bacterium]